MPGWVHDDSAIVFGFSTRLGGVSTSPFDTLNLGRSTADDAAAVDENRHRFLVSLDLDPKQLATAGQVHGAHVTRVEAAGLHPECDALITTVPGLSLAVTTADCVPLVFIAPRAVAVAHAGWRGTASHIPRAALVGVCDASGVTPAELQVYLGPCIRSCCYAVHAEVAGQFDPVTCTTRGGTTYLDLAAAIRLQLEHAGLPEAHVADVGECTACQPQRYFSHRRDGPRTGRHWVVVAMRDSRSLSTASE